MGFKFLAASKICLTYDMTGWFLETLTVLTLNLTAVADHPRVDKYICDIP